MPRDRSSNEISTICPRRATRRDRTATFVVLGAHCQRPIDELIRELREVCASSRFQTRFDEAESLNPAKNLSKQLAGDGDPRRI